MPRRLDVDRRDDLLDGVMGIIAERGFSSVRISDLAQELHCSPASLYKLGPSKESIVLVAIARWGGQTLADLEAVIRQCTTASDRARTYFRAGAATLRPFSVAFFADVERFESTRLAWRTGVTDRFIDRFANLVQSAEDAGEIRAVNIRFLAEVLRQIAFVTRDDRVLRDTGLSHEEAVLEVDSLLWKGILIGRERE